MYVSIVNEYGRTIQINTRQINFVQIAGKDINFGNDLKMDHYLKVLFLYFNPQSYGARIQNRLIKEYDLEKIKSSLDKGDAISRNNLYLEIKASYRNIEDEFSFVQIRPYQNCDLYLLTAIDVEDNFKLYNFLINKQNISEFLTKVKAGNCHGVSKNKKDTSNEELRFTVKFNSDLWKFMVKNYLTSFEEIKAQL